MQRCCGHYNVLLCGINVGFPPDNIAPCRHGKARQQRPSPYWQLGAAQANELSGRCQQGCERITISNLDR
eukprot:11178485-Lingulodinium_polyedra.AAC.1